MKYLMYAFFSGLFLFNALPHLVQGICGNPHMTPFGISSSPAVNVIWAWCNILAGGLLLKLCASDEWPPRFWAAFCLGGFILSLFLSIFWSNPDARLPWQ